MHEMGVLFTMAEQVHKIAQDNHVSNVSAVTVEVGQISGILPFFLKKYYLIVTEDDPLLRNSRLIIHETPAQGICQNCQTLYHIKKCKGLCPACQSRRRTVISGRDFILKSIETKVEKRASENNGESEWNNFES
jgi:hydrogenase nickel incorporation protein HypA/HybF